jgi:vitamin B12 transporter
VNTNGAELALQWQMAKQWKTFLNYTYTDARIASGAERGQQLALVPFSVAQLGVGYESNGWQVNLYTNYYSGARRSLFNLPTDSVTEFSPSWLNVDLNLRVPITQGLGLVVYLENLGGRTYERVNRLYQPGFTFKVGLTSTF